MQSETVQKSKQQRRVDSSLSSPLETKLYELYHEEDLTQSEIGERFGIARRTVSKWLSDFGIDTRGPGVRPGQLHPRWQGGLETVSYPLRVLMGDRYWGEILEEERDDSCFMCGDEECELHLHHIVPLVCGGTNESWNFMTLCDKCHPTVEHFTKELIGFQIEVER